MIDIYDEVSYIKNIIQNGFSNRWIRDARILVKFYRSEGIKKSDVKEKLKEKCKKYIDNYDPYVSYKMINKIMEYGWNKKNVLRTITPIVTSEKILNWFNNQDLKSEEKRILFTWYIWTKIQEQYIEQPMYHFYIKSMKYFKQSADVMLSTNLSKSIKDFDELGYISLTSKNNVYVRFMENNLFKEEIQKKDQIVIQYDDMYNCGYYFSKYFLGVQECIICGKETIKSKNRKYCKECARVEKTKKTNINYQPVGIKIINCKVCEKQVEIDSSIKNKTRCDVCQREYRKAYNLEKQKKYLDQK